MAKALKQMLLNYEQLQKHFQVHNIFIWDMAEYKHTVC